MKRDGGKEIIQHAFVRHILYMLIVAFGSEYNPKHDR